MGYNERTVGGGPAKQLGKDFTGFLGNLINTGSFGRGTAGQQAGAANPMGDTAGIFGLLNSIVSNPAADQAVQQLLSKQQERNVNDIRARFGASGGTAFGTPAAFAEGIYRAESTPQIAAAMDQLSQNRLASLMPFFNQAYGLSQLGIPQAQATLEPSGLLQGINIATDIAKTAANFIPGGQFANMLPSGSRPPAGVTPISTRGIVPPVTRPVSPIGGYNRGIPYGQQFYS